MQGKQILFIVIGVIVIVFGARYYQESVQQADACSAEVLEALPECADQTRVGSNVIVENQCGFDVTVHWDIIGGSDYLTDLAPGTVKRVAAYPLNIRAVSCCPQYNRCF